MKDLIHFYRVNDLSKVRIFYGEVLHLKLYKDQGKCLIYETNGHGKIGFCLHFPNKELQQSCITFVYETTIEVDQMFNLMRSHELNPDEASYHQEFRIYHFFVKDPNNLQLEFQTFMAL